MPILIESQRHEKIINYVSLHQGCSKEEVCDALHDILSRNTFFKDLSTLVEEGKIIVKPINKRDTSLYIDKNNPLIYVPKQLEDFEAAYTQLLEASTKRFKAKDFSEIAYILGIRETDPAKWSVDDSLKFIKYDGKIARESIKHIDKIKEKITKHIEKIESFHQGIGELTKRLSEVRHTPTKEDIKVLNQVMSSLKTFDEFELDEEMGFKQIEGYEVGTMIYSCIRIYFVLIDIITNLSITMWPKVIRDEQSLKRLYALVFSKIAEVQFKLSSFLNSLSVFLIYDPTQFLITAKLSYKNTGLLNGITRNYRALNMRTEIDSVLNSISRISTDLVKFGYNGGIDEYEEAIRKFKETTSGDIKIQIEEAIKLVDIMKQRK